MSLQVDGVDFFTAILDRTTGEFVCWYYTPEGEELVKNLDLNNRKYTLLDVAAHAVKDRGMPEPVNYKAPTPECEIPPYTEEQVFILNLLKGLDDLIEKVVTLPIEGFTRQDGVDYPTVKSSSAIEAVVKFKDDFQAGKIA